MENPLPAASGVVSPLAGNWTGLLRLHLLPSVGVSSDAGTLVGWGLTPLLLNPIQSAAASRGPMPHRGRRRWATSQSQPQLPLFPISI